VKTLLQNGHAFERFAGAFIAIALCVLGTAQAQELIVNGGFETGNLNGWTVTSGTSIQIDSNPNEVIHGQYSARISADPSTTDPVTFDTIPGSDGVITQTFATVPGGLYLLKFAYTSGTTNGGYSIIEANVSGSNSSTLFDSTFAQGPVSATFVANSTSTTLSIRSSTDPNSDPYGIIDDLSVKQSKFSHPGRYAGAITFSHKFQGVNDITSSTTEHFVMRIDGSGRMYMAESGAGALITGLIQDGGKVSTDNFMDEPASYSFSNNVLKFNWVRNDSFSDPFSVKTTTTCTAVFTRISN